MRKLRPGFLVALGIVIVAAGFWKLWQAYSAHRAALDTQLIEAVHDEDLAAVEALLEKGARVRAHDQDGDTAIQMAAGLGNTEIVRALIRAGADVNDLGRDATVGWSPLHMAAGQGHLEVVELLLDNGADVNVNTRTCDTPFIHAVCRGHRDVAELLISRGADPHAKGAMSGRTPLLAAVRFDRIGIARWLLENGADPNAASDFGNTPLGAAAERGNEEMVDLLISRGARVTVHVAAALGDVETVRGFLAEGVDPDIKDGRDRPPLFFAVRMGRVQVADELIRAGADVNGPREPALIDRMDGEKVTAALESFLHIAARRGNDQIVRLLIASGADVNVREPSWGLTPLDVAVHAKHDSIAEILRENGGKTLRELLEARQAR